MRKRVALDSYSAVMIVDKHRVAADGIKETIFNSAIFGAFEEHRPAAMNTPVARRRYFIFVHKSGQGMCKIKTCHLYMADRRFSGADEIDQLF